MSIECIRLRHFCQTVLLRKTNNLEIRRQRHKAHYCYDWSIKGWLLTNRTFVPACSLKHIHNLYV